MELSAPVFYLLVLSYINWVVLFFCLVVDVMALLHCAVQRAEPFAAIGTLSKGAWLGLIGAGTLLTALSPFLLLGFINLFAMAAIAVSAIYLLDARGPVSLSVRTTDDVTVLPARAAHPASAVLIAVTVAVILISAGLCVAFIRRLTTLQQSRFADQA